MGVVHRYQPEGLLRALHRALEHLADPAHVALGVHDTGFQPGALGRSQRVPERGKRDSDAGVEARDAEAVLGVPPEVLLVAAGADARMRRHEDSGTRALDPRVPGALAAGHAARAVQLGGVL